MYWFGGDYQFKNTSFQIDQGYKENILIPNENGGFTLIQSYDWSSLEDFIFPYSDYFYFIC